MEPPTLVHSLLEAEDLTTALPQSKAAALLGRHEFHGRARLQRSGRRCRQEHGERRAPLRLRLYPDAAAVMLDDAARDGEAEPAARRPPGVAVPGLGELLED